MDAFTLILFPIFFLGVLGFLTFISPVNQSQISIYIDNITCPVPVYSNDTAWNQPCAGIENDQPYTDQSTFAIPTGWLKWLGDTFETIGVKIFVMFTMLGTYITPPTTLLGFDLQSALILIWPFYIGIYIMLAIGFYKVLSPFG